jgi:hypothetical protein
MHGGVLPDDIRIVVLELNGFNANDSIFISSLRREIATGDYPSPIRNIITLDASEFLDDDDYFLIDDHMKPIGHRVVAERIVTVMN